MYKDNVVGVVIPAYNEEDHIADVVSTVPSFVDRVYVIDDRSTDDTWAEIQRAAGHIKQQTISGNSEVYDSKIVPVQHETNRGVGGAIKTGYLKALEDDIDTVAVMGGDGQMDPTLLKGIIDPVVEGYADYAKGNRFLRQETRRNVPPFRTFGNLLLSGLSKIASGYWAIGDSQNGYSAISKEALETVDIEEMYEFYGYCNDLLVKLNVANMVVADVPTPIRYGDETSSINYHTYVPRVSRLLFANFVWRLKEKYLIKDFNPIVLLYSLGMVGGITSVVYIINTLRSADIDNATAQTLTNFLISTLLIVQGMMKDKAENDHLAKRIEERSGPLSLTGSTDPSEDDDFQEITSNQDK